MAVQDTIIPPAPRTGTGFVNLQKYLQANQANQLGQNIAGGVTGVAQGTQQQLSGAQQQFQKDLQSNRFASPDNQQYISNTINQAASGQGPSQNDVSKFQTYQSGQYAGPQGLSNQQQLLGGAQEAQSLGKATLSDEGRKMLLQRFVGNQSPYGTYTGGEQKLDTLLLGQQRPQLQEAQRQAQGLVPKVQQGIDVAQQQAQTASGENQAVAKDIAQKIGTAQTGVQTGIQNLVDQRLQQQQQLAQQAQQDPYSVLNVTRQSTYGLDPRLLSGFINVTPAGNITTSSVASQQDLAKLNALAQLSGQPQTFISNFGAIGTETNAPLSNINQAGLQQAISGQKTQYQQELNKPSYFAPQGTSVGRATAGGNMSQAQADRFNQLSQQLETSGLSIPEQIERNNLMAYAYNSLPQGQAAAAQMNEPIMKALQTIQSKYGQVEAPETQATPGAMIRPQ